MLKISKKSFLPFRRGAVAPTVHYNAFTITPPVDACFLLSSVDWYYNISYLNTSCGKMKSLPFVPAQGPFSQS